MCLICKWTHDFKQCDIFTNQLAAIAAAAAAAYYWLLLMIMMISCDDKLMNGGFGFTNFPKFTHNPFATIYFDFFIFFYFRRYTTNACVCTCGYVYFSLNYTVNEIKGFRVSPLNWYLRSFHLLACESDYLERKKNHWNVCLLHFTLLFFCHSFCSSVPSFYFITFFSMSR